MNAESELDISRTHICSAGHFSEIGIAQRGCGPSKLRRVGHVEHFSAELYFVSFLEPEVLEQSEVSVARGTESNVRSPPGQVADLVGPGSFEGVRVEPTIGRGIADGGSVQVCNVRPLNLEAVVAKRIRRRKGQRKPAAEAHDAGDLPTAQDRVDNRVSIR